jgi:hypothetical protein
MCEEEERLTSLLLFGRDAANVEAESFSGASVKLAK